MMNIVIARDWNDFARCIMIRTRVFVVEQNIAADLETDEWENTATHYLARDNGKPVAAARSRFIDNQTVKIERVAVLQEARGNGIGTELMHCILTQIQLDSNIQTVKVGSQNAVIPFYQKLGFHIVGEEYFDADIPHHMMIKTIK